MTELKLYCLSELQFSRTLFINSTKINSAPTIHKTLFLIQVTRQSSFYPQTVCSLITDLSNKETGANSKHIQVLQLCVLRPKFTDNHSGEFPACGQLPSSSAHIAPPVLVIASPTLGKLAQLASRSNPEVRVEGMTTQSTNPPRIKLGCSLGQEIRRHVPCGFSKRAPND